MDDAKHQEGIRVARMMADFYLSTVRPRQNAHALKTTGFPLGAQIPEPSKDGHNGTSTIRHNGEPVDGGVCSVDLSLSGPVSELPLQGVRSVDSGTITPGPSNK
jgi:hypothetical protein